MTYINPTWKRFHAGTRGGQISIEYLIVLSFVTFLVISILGLSALYIDGIRDTVSFRQLETYADKIVRGSESVYYAGQPSKVSITAYLPAGVTNVQVLREGLLITLVTSSGESRTLFSSAVPLNSTDGTLLSGEGLHRIQLTATSDAVRITNE